jgi:hypothetical protein
VRQKKGKDIIMKIGKFIRIAAILVIAAMLMTSLAGCSQNEMNLLKALLNTEPVYSYETVGNIEFSFDVVENKKMADFSNGYTGTIIRFLSELLDGSGLAYSIKVDCDKEYNNVKEELIFTPSLLGGQLKNLTFGMWADFRSGDPANSSMCFKVPPLYTSINKNTAGKDYLTLNFGEIMAMAGEDADIDIEGWFDLGGIVKQASEFSKPICDGIIKAALLLNPDEVYVGNPRPIVDEFGKRGYVYTLKITDSGLKKLLKSIVNDIDKESAKEILLTTLDATIKYMDSMADLSYIYQDIVEELEYLKEELEDNFDFGYEMVIPRLNVALDSLNNVRILGNRGVAVDIEVDSRGFVTGCKGIIEFAIDIETIAKLTGWSPIEISRVDFSIKFDQKLTRINQKVSVEMPEITKENSFSIMNLLSYLDY